MLAVFLAGLASTALGALLVFADRPLYTLPDSTVSGVAQRLADQQVAGVVMWAYGGVLTATGAMALFVAWIRDAERRTATSAVVLRSILPLAPVAAAVAVACTTLLSPPSGDAAAAPSRPDPSGIYERDCAECHGSGGGGTAKGPAIAEEGAASIDYVVSTGRMPIEDPDDEIKRGPAAYDRPTTIALAEYVASLGDGADAWPIPDVDVAAADVPNGGELYRLNCAACHQSVGFGGALIERAAPGLDAATATEAAEAIRVGPFEMPAFGRAALSDDEVADVTAYVTEVLQHSQDRGGWAIWHLGPVPEGAVAILIGLALMTLAAVWIEGRAS